MNTALQYLTLSQRSPHRYRWFLKVIIEGDRQHLCGQHEGREHQDEEHGSSWKAEACKAIGNQRGDRRAYHCGIDRQEEAICYIAAKAIAVVVVIEGGLVQVGEKNREAIMISQDTCDA